MQTDIDSKLHDLLGREGLVSTRRIAQELGIQVADARSLLNRMWEEQKVGRRFAPETTYADIQGGAELWHLVGWKPASRQVREPKPQTTLRLRPKRSASPTKETGSGSIAILDFLGEFNHPLSAADIRRRTGKGKKTIAKALRALSGAGLLVSTGFKEGHCHVCGSPTFGREVFSMTEEGRELLTWMKENREKLALVRAIG